ncbi:hypothetical protein IVB46_19290 [Bradyrhizobium sp. 61]|uniref:hypothetical protein n=1 Tax=unclassified Bradyrhizobium TaxID=2631580 RepID=UPI001FF9BBCB|nr:MULTISPECIES: hypothetical protein [unclassified Bradyrhizobium]MCK1277375.1 hypothetical protein [Bradyrhizobium sp. 61]MCK1440957.1 hypothetical protein [Bradyrhizobium sp. 48]MCK1465603.1 hypothetical protein [Bradyrhizobium sp. 2]
MTAIEPVKASSVPRKAKLDIVRPLASRRLLLIVAMLIAAALAGVAALNWRWLVAVGAVSVLVSTLPCLLMCGLGLCMHKFGGRTGANSVDELSAVGASDVHIGAPAQRPPAEGCCSGGDHRFGEEPAMQSREKNNA